MNSNILHRTPQKSKRICGLNTCVYTCVNHDCYLYLTTIWGPGPQHQTLPSYYQHQILPGFPKDHTEKNTHLTDEQTGRTVPWQWLARRHHEVRVRSKWESLQPKEEICEWPSSKIPLGSIVHYHFTCGELKPSRSVFQSPLRNGEELPKTSADKASGQQQGY